VQVTLAALPPTVSFARAYTGRIFEDSTGSEREGEGDGKIGRGEILVRERGSELNWRDKVEYQEIKREQGGSRHSECIRI
jgi:hypothetical protein